MKSAGAGGSGREAARRVAGDEQCRWQRLIANLLTGITGVNAGRLAYLSGDRPEAYCVINRAVYRCAEHRQTRTTAGRYVMPELGACANSWQMSNR